MHLGMNSKRALDILKKNDPINRMNLLTVIPLSGFHCIIICKKVKKSTNVILLSLDHANLLKHTYNHSENRMVTKMSKIRTYVLYVELKNIKNEIFCYYNLQQVKRKD